MKKFIRVIAFIFITFSAKAGEPLFVLTNDLENITDSAWINSGTIQTGEAHSGNRYCTTDFSSPYGIGYHASFPEQCRNKNLIIRIKEHVRLKSDAKEFGMVASVILGDSTIYWNLFNLDEKIKSSGEWIEVEDKFTLPKTLTGAEFKLKIYFWNNDPITRIDVDDIEISFEEMPLRTFLPQESKLKSRPEKYEDKFELKNAVAWLNAKDGGLYLEDKNEDSLFSYFSIVTEIVKKGKVESQWINRWEEVGDSVSQANGLMKFVIASDVSHSDLIISTIDPSKIVFSLTTVFDRNTNISRHALVFNYHQDLESVYKNSIETNENFNNEYWLGRDGMTLRKGENQFIIYRPPLVSSLQLNVKSKQIIVNADYAGDHPMLHFPLLSKGSGRMEDASHSIYKKGDTLKCEFIIHRQNTPALVPTLLESSYGFLSTFVWTEHADYTDMRTNRAVYFGSEKITRADSATGGFIRYSIPVTKSVFYSNPKPVDNGIKAAFLKGPEATVKETEGFRNYLKQLYEMGIEICLHTPDHFTTEKKLLDESLSNMRREFESITWIDHGYDNAAASNREDLNCDGTNPASPYYAADLWKKYGIKYLWNSFYEDSGLYSPYGFYSFFTVPYAGFNDPFPMPAYWKHQSRTGDFVHWRTTSTLDFPDGLLWSYMFNDLRLKDVVNNRSTIVIHCYPARADSTTGFYDVVNNEIVANRGFNDALSKLSEYRKDGTIRICTVREMLDHRLSLQKIRYEFPGNGIVRIKNEGAGTIHGATFSVKASEIKSSKKDLRQKTINGDLIFWMDIEGGETIDLLLK